MAESHLRWRVRFHANGSGNDGVILSEVELWSGGVNVTASATRYAPNAMNGGGGSQPTSIAANITDGDLTTNCYWNSGAVTSESQFGMAAVDFVFAAPIAIDHIRIGASPDGWASAYYPPACRAQWQDAGGYDPNQFNWNTLLTPSLPTYPGAGTLGDFIEIQEAAAPVDFSSPAIPFAFTGNARHDGAIPIEFAHAPFAVTIDAPALPIESGIALRAEVPVPVQWAGSIVVTIDASVPLAWAALTFADIEAAPLHFEHIAPSFADNEIPIESVLAALVDYHMPIEYGGYFQPFNVGSSDAWHMPRRSNVWRVQRTRRVTA